MTPYSPPIGIGDFPDAGRVLPAYPDNTARGGVDE